jgi:uncharacterized membrane protein YphA (DoxX/SURF4 family)
MRGIFGLDPGWGITAVRLAAALVFIHAGYGKLFVSGVDKVTANMTKYGLPVPEAFAWIAATMELFGGLLFFLAGPGRAAVDGLWLEKGARAAPRVVDARGRTAA